MSVFFQLKLCIRLYIISFLHSTFLFIHINADEFPLASSIRANYHQLKQISYLCRTIYCKNFPERRNTHLKFPLCHSKAFQFTFLESRRSLHITKTYSTFWNIEQEKYSTWSLATKNVVFLFRVRKCFISFNVYTLHTSNWTTTLVRREANKMNLVNYFHLAHK